MRQVQSRLEQIGQKRSSSPGPQRVELLRLAERFPALWSDAVTDNRIKKRIARTLIEEIIASVDQGRREVELIIRWRGGKHTRLQVRKNATGRHRYRTEEDVVKLVRQLARQVSDDQIARILNRMGKKTGRGHNWNQSRVRSLRNYRRIPAFSQRSQEFCNHGKKRLRNWESAPVPSASWFAANSCQHGRWWPRPPGRFGTRTWDLKQSNEPPRPFEAAEEFREVPTRHN